MFFENDHSKQLFKNLSNRIQQQKKVIEYNYRKNTRSNHENNTENRDYKNLKKLPWIPDVSPKIKREFKKIGKHIACTPGKNLQQKRPWHR